jgi:hypothetical protein
MKKMRSLSALVVAVLAFYLPTQAQGLDSTLAQYADKFQQEKVWLHYDKASYYPGETIWFKAYLMEGLIPAHETKTFYVDWVGDNGQVLYHSVSPVVDAVSNGQFEIPDDYNGNFIHVRAYTRWMLNFDTAFLYSKDIRVYSKNSSSKAPPKSAAAPSLQFFPEGGDAIAGVNNRIAFIATDQWGIPVRVMGVIQNGQGAVVDSFRAVHDGMGSFFLLPQAGASYTAKWKDAKGAEHTTSLPAIKPEGISMQVVTAGTKRYINLNCSNNAPGNLKQVHLIGTMGQRTIFKTDASFAAGNGVRKIIPTESLPSGILTITLFDAGWNAIAERITFVNNHEYSFQPTMEVEHWGLNKRARNDIQVTIPDSLEGASLSIAVTDAAIDRDTSNNIISHLLLTSDLKGYVHNPSYYFSNTSDSAVQYLDLVMLTHGWRRFKWEDVAKGKLPSITYPKDTSYLSLSGKVYGVAKSQLSGKETILLLIKGKDSGTKMAMIPLERNGTFSDPSFIFFDTLRVYYQLKSKFFSNAEAKFLTDRLPAFNYQSASKYFATLPNPFGDTSGNYRHSQLAAEALRLQNMARGKMLENITVTAKTKPPLQVMDEKYASALFRSGDGYQFDLVNDPFAMGQQSIFTYLQGKVAGLQISTGSGTPSLSWRGGAPQLYLDEMPVDADFINSLPVSDVAYIKVLRPPFMGTSGGGNGAIAIYTRKGDDAKNTPGKGLSSNNIAGYTPIREFYSPNYDRFDKRNEQRDVRTTLYWNPVINLSPKNKSVKLSFYNNDVTKSFRVVIEGMSREGVFTHYEEVME